MVQWLAPREFKELCARSIPLVDRLGDLLEPNAQLNNAPPGSVGELLFRVSASLEDVNLKAISEAAIAEIRESVTFYSITSGTCTVASAALSAATQYLSDSGNAKSFKSLAENTAKIAELQGRQRETDFAKNFACCTALPMVEDVLRRAPASAIFLYHPSNKAWSGFREHLNGRASLPSGAKVLGLYHSTQWHDMIKQIIKLSEESPMTDINVLFPSDHAYFIESPGLPLKCRRVKLFGHTNKNGTPLLTLADSFKIGALRSSDLQPCLFSLREMPWRFDNIQFEYEEITAKSIAKSVVVGAAGTAGSLGVIVGIAHGAVAVGGATVVAGGTIVCAPVAACVMLAAVTLSFGGTAWAATGVCVPKVRK